LRDVNRGVVFEGPFFQQQYEWKENTKYETLTLVHIYQTIPCHIPEDNGLHIHCCENLNYERSNRSEILGLYLPKD
jgi:hypothetical protein